MKEFQIEGKLYNVVMTADAWNHIKQNHAIMENNLSAIVDAIKDPVIVYQSIENPETREVYFGKTTEATYSDLYYTKVVVDKPDAYNSVGYIVSAWPQESITGGINNEIAYIRKRKK